MLGLVGPALLAALAGAAPPAAASLDCASRWLNRAEQVICGDPQLMRAEQQLTQRLSSFASRLNFGQYLGLRHWHAVRARQRSLCAADRECIAASLRAQGRSLDRLQRCVGGSLTRRACLREMLAAEQDSSRR
ncbi:MAG TPA: hypothetical protein VN524_15540 [Hyphomicrobiaceae bacterium]|jgi:uncharacterized protein|nr:hypothetical protein [Hyphomicrobiaceae bacterium]